MPTALKKRIPVKEYEERVREILRARFDVCAVISAAYVAIWVFIPSAIGYDVSRTLLFVGLGLSFMFIMFYAFLLLQNYLVRDGFYLMSMRTLFSVIICYFASFVFSLAVVKIFSGYEWVRHLAIPMVLVPAVLLFLYDRLTDKVTIAEKRVRRLDKKEASLREEVEAHEAAVKIMKEELASKKLTIKKLDRRRKKVGRAMRKAKRIEAEKLRPGELINKLKELTVYDFI
jgi:FlaA1/EpsC-like NDP-sugar epimerase